MKSPYTNENAALQAAFSLANAKRWNKPITTAHTTQIWHGWTFSADELIDSGGNRYGQSEIRAIFYTRQLLNDYRDELQRLQPRPKAQEPVQLSLNLTPLWKMRAI